MTVSRKDAKAQSVKTVIIGPGVYRDKEGREASVHSIAPHNKNRWIGIAGDGDPACWEKDGVMECSHPSGVDLVVFLRAFASLRETNGGAD